MSKLENGDITLNTDGKTGELIEVQATCKSNGVADVSGNKLIIRVKAHTFPVYSETGVLTLELSDKCCANDIVSHFRKDSKITLLLCPKDQNSLTIKKVLAGDVSLTLIQNKPSPPTTPDS